MERLHIEIVGHPVQYIMEFPDTSIMNIVTIAKKYLRYGKTIRVYYIMKAKTQQEIYYLGSIIKTTKGWYWTSGDVKLKWDSKSKSLVE